MNIAFGVRLEVNQEGVHGDDSGVDMVVKSLVVEEHTHGAVR